MTLLPLLLSLLQAPTAHAENTPYALIPADWLEENAEYAGFTTQPSRTLPVAPVVSEWKEDLTQTNRYLFSIAFDRTDDSKVFLAFDSGDVMKLDHTTGQPVWTAKVGDHAEAFATSKDGRLVAVGAFLGKVTLLDGLSGQPLREIEGICGHYCTSLAISADDRWLAVGDADGMVTLIELGTAEVVWKKQVHAWPVRRVVAITAGQRLFLLSTDVSEIVLWDPDAEQPIRRIKGELSEGGQSDFWVNSLTYVDDSNFFVVGGYKDVFVVDAQTSETLKRYTGPDQSIMQAFASKDLTKVIGVSRDQVVYQWDTETGEIADQKWMKATVWGTFFDGAISPTGAYTAVGSMEAVFGFPPQAYNKLKIYATAR